MFPYLSLASSAFIRFLQGENIKEKIKADRDQKKDEYNQLVDKSRQYSKLTKNMQETWQYYDKLLQKCNELGINANQLMKGSDTICDSAMRC